MLAAIAFNRTPFFRGKDAEEQLYKIEEVLGTEDLKKYIAKYNLQLPNNTFIHATPCKRKPWSSFAKDGLVKFQNEDLYDYLDKTLVYDPNVGDREGNENDQ